MFFLRGGEEPQTFLNSSFNFEELRGRSAESKQSLSPWMRGSYSIKSWMSDPHFCLLCLRKNDNAMIKTNYIVPWHKITGKGTPLMCFSRPGVFLSMRS